MGNYLEIRAQSYEDKRDAILQGGGDAALEAARLAQDPGCCINSSAWAIPSGNVYGEAPYFWIEGEQ